MSVAEIIRGGLHHHDHLAVHTRKICYKNFVEALWPWLKQELDDYL